MLTTNSIEKQILIDVINNPGDIFYENVLSDFLDEQGVEHDFRKPLHNNKITELKPYQEKCLDIWTKHWIDIGLCTKPTNEDKADRYFCNFYKELGFLKPKKIIWFDNPVEMCRKVSSQASSWDQIWYQIRYYISDTVWSQVSNQIFYKVWNQVESKIWSQIDNDNWSYNIQHGRKQYVWRLSLYSYCMQNQLMRIKPNNVFIIFIIN
jgi:hypothetical protein